MCSFRRIKKKKTVRRKESNEQYQPIFQFHSRTIQEKCAFPPRKKKYAHQPQLYTLKVHLLSNSADSE